MKARTFSVVLAAVASVLVVPAAPGTGTPTGGCGQARAAARPDGAFNERFAAYGDDNAEADDWTGGDGTYSVRLPDGRDAWVFSDTFLGRVREDGSRPADAPFLNNTAVLQDGETLVETLHGGTPAEPTALFVAEVPSSWYWPQEGVVEGDRLQVFLQEFVKTGPEPWDFEWVDTDVATLSLPDLTLLSITPVAAGSAVAYGAAVVERGGYTYVYGVEDLPFVNHLHLARAPAGGLLGPWEFRTASGWSSDPGDTVRLLGGVGNGLGVTPLQGRFVLVTMADSDFFGNEIVARVACVPWGSWGPESHVYTTPENEGGLFSYNAHTHQQFADGGRLLVSYDVNTFRGQDLWRDVTIYRPRFLRVDLRLVS